MKPIQIVAFDLDGTVLDSQKHLSDRNREALSACARRGVYIVPTTGRSASGIIPEIKNIPGIRYAITTNGGTITDLKTGEVLERQTISNTKAIRLMKMISRYHAMYDPYIKGRGISQPRFYDHMEEFGYPGIRRADGGGCGEDQHFSGGFKGPGASLQRTGTGAGSGDHLIPL